MNSGSLPGTLKWHFRIPWAKGREPEIRIPASRRPPGILISGSMPGTLKYDFRIVVAEIVLQLQISRRSWGVLVVASTGNEWFLCYFQRCKNELYSGRPGRDVGAAGGAHRR